MVTVKGKVQYEPVLDFWIPTTKLGLLNYLTQQFPKDATKFMHMSKKRIMAIYLNERRKQG